MKKLLLILMAVIGFSAYAEQLNLINDSTAYLAVECFPSQKVCNGISPGVHACTCPADDTYMYFGRVDMPQDETTYLIPHTTFTATFHNNGYTNYQQLGNGNVWKIFKGTNNPDDNIQDIDVDGDPSFTVAGSFYGHD